MFDEVRAIAIKDGVAFVAAGKGGLRAVDMTDPAANPLLMPMDRAKTVTAVFVPAPKPFWSCGSASGEMPRGTGSDIAAVLLSALLLAAWPRIRWRPRE